MAQPRFSIRTPFRRLSDPCVRGRCDQSVGKHTYYRIGGVIGTPTSDDHFGLGLADNAIRVWESTPEGALGSPFPTEAILTSAPMRNR